MRTSGGCWRTLLGLADFAIVQSYLSTTAKWGIDASDALMGAVGSPRAGLRSGAGDLAPVAAGG
jgi:hypothetical protein